MMVVKDIHPQAMDLAELAFTSRRAGKEDEAKALFGEAMQLERQAASLLAATPESEPSRSVLYRSAAALAYHAGDYEQADWLIANGLAGFPPPEIKKELKELLDDVSFVQRHFAQHRARQQERLRQLKNKESDSEIEIDAQILSVITDIDRQIVRLEFKKTSLLSLVGAAAATVQRRQSSTTSKATSAKKHPLSGSTKKKILGATKSR